MTERDDVAEVVCETLDVFAGWLDAQAHDVTDTRGALGIHPERRGQGEAYRKAAEKARRLSAEIGRRRA